MSRTKEQSTIFRDDPDYDPNPGSGLRSASRGGGLQSLTDCPVHLYYLFWRLCHVNDTCTFIIIYVFCRSDPNHLYGGKTKLVNGDGPMLNNNKVTPQKDSNRETGGEQTHSNEVKQGQTEDHNKKMRGDLATYNEAKVQRERRLRQRQINCEEQAQVWLKFTQQFSPTWSCVSHNFKLVKIPHICLISDLTFKKSWCCTVDFVRNNLIG